jgi:anti-sigma factor RsiW
MKSWLRRHPRPEDLSRFLEGELSAGKGRRLERHLDGCDQCADLLADLRTLQNAARDLPGQDPPRDLWPEIAQAIRELEGRGSDVIRLYPDSYRTALARKRAFRLSIPQAVAVGVVLALASGLLGARLGQAPVGQGGPVAESQESFVAVVAAVSPDLEGSAREVARLEEVLSRHRSELEPETAEVLLRNLRAIDAAIQESLEALGRDPGNRFLMDHLARAITTKGDYLKDASLLLSPIS